VGHRDDQPARQRDHIYSKQVVEKEKQLLMALAQKVFREVTENERLRIRELIGAGL